MERNVRQQGRTASSRGVVKREHHAAMCVRDSPTPTELSAIMHSAIKKLLVAQGAWSIVAAAYIFSVINFLLYYKTSLQPDQNVR
jgi:hypothetical protein